MYYNDDIYATKEELEKLISQTKRMVSEFDQMGKNSDYFKELSNLALLQIEAGYLEESEINLLECLKFFEQEQDNLGQASVYGILGTLFFKKGEYQKSIENYNKALGTYKRLNQVAEEIMCLKGIAANFIKLHNLENACEKYIECSTLCSENNDIYNLLDCLGNLIYIYETKKEWDMVFELYKKSLEAFKTLGDKKGIITSYFNLGIIQKRDKNYEESVRYFKLGTNTAIDANYTELILKGLSYVGEILVYQGKLSEAKQEYVRALYIAKKINAKNSILQLNVLLKSLGLSNTQIESEVNNYTEKL